MHYFSGKGCFEFLESMHYCIGILNSLIKREWLNQFKNRDYEHTYRLVFEYLEAFYNTKRIHSHCDYMSLNDYEDLYRRLQLDELQLAG